MRKLFFISLLVTVVTMIVISVTGKPLKTSVAPSGIVSFEMAGSLEKAQAILSSWDNQTKVYAAFNLGIDYLYLIAYPLCIFSGLLLLRNLFKSTKGFFPDLLKLSAQLQFLAGFFDAVENYALLRLLFGAQTSSLLPVLARFCAIIKFSIVGYGILLLLVATGVYFSGSRRALQER